MEANTNGIQPRMDLDGDSTDSKWLTKQHQYQVSEDPKVYNGNFGLRRVVDKQPLISTKSQNSMKGFKESLYESLSIRDSNCQTPNLRDDDQGN